jgi:hypothetical protein
MSTRSLSAQRTNSSSSLSTQQRSSERNSPTAFGSSSYQNDTTQFGNGGGMTSDRARNENYFAKLGGENEKRSE